MTLMSRISLSATATVLMLVPVVSSEAKVVCDGPYQAVDGAAVVTPYCEAENLARVARSRGIATSAAAIRDDHATLKHVCMDLHGDPRVEVTCSLYTQSPF